MKITDMNIKKDKLKVLLGLGLLILIIVLFRYSLAERNIEAVFARWTPTPGPIYDVFIVRCEHVLEVLKGDTLDTIAYNFSVSKEYIVQHNRLKSEEISPGMMLLIPMCYSMPTPTVTPVK